MLPTPTTIPFFLNPPLGTVKFLFTHPFSLRSHPRPLIMTGPLTLARGKWISWRASKHFILLARLGKLPGRIKLGIFKFSYIEQWENESTCCPLNLYPLPRYPSGHCLMASEFYSGQLIFMINFPWGPVVKKSKVTRP
jgi:hypothetical protein